jgi:hypothetical protein
MRRLAALLLAAAVLAGCGAREVLVPRPGEPPPGVDFSGTWVLRADANAERRRLNEAIARTDGVNERRIVRQVQEPGREGMIVERRLETGGLVHVFLQHGKQLKITQTPTARSKLMKSAVVQEYRFGEHREVSVGPVIADRVSGWDGDAYVVETLDEDRMKLTERFELANGGERLLRTIVLRGKNGESVTLVQEFDRVQS